MPREIIALILVYFALGLMTVGWCSVRQRGYMRPVGIVFVLLAWWMYALFTLGAALAKEQPHETSRH
jgi:hypothetical protein